MAGITYSAHSRNVIRVERDGAFLAYLTRGTHKPTGLDAKRYDIWECRIAGVEVHANTVTEAKKKIAAIKQEG